MSGPSPTADPGALIRDCPDCHHGHRCEDYDTEPGVIYHAHDLRRCRETAVGRAIDSEGWLRFVCQRHLDAWLAHNTSSRTDS